MSTKKALAAKLLPNQRMQRGSSKPSGAKVCVQGISRTGRSLTLAPMSAAELTDQQWEHLEPLLPPQQPRGCPRADDRKTLNGSLYVLRTRCNGRDVPRETGLLLPGGGLRRW